MFFLFSQDGLRVGATYFYIFEFCAPCRIVSRQCGHGDMLIRSLLCEHSKNSSLFASLLLIFVSIHTLCILVIDVNFLLKKSTYFVRV